LSGGLLGTASSSLGVITISPSTASSPIESVGSTDSFSAGTNRRLDRFGKMEKGEDDLEGFADDESEKRSRGPKRTRRPRELARKSKVSSAGQSQTTRAEAERVIICSEIEEEQNFSMQNEEQT
jgi:hypothetical protein